MRQWLFATALVPLLCGGAPAVAQSVPLAATREPPPAAPRLNFRLVDDPVAAPGPVHNSGMIAHTDVGPNATVGVGLLKASPKKFGSGDWHPDPNAPRSRKAAVTFRLKF